MMKKFLHGYLFVQGHTATMRSAWNSTGRAWLQSPGSVLTFYINPLFSLKQSGVIKCPEPFSHVGALPELKTRPAGHLKKNDFLKKEPGQMPFILWHKKQKCLGSSSLWVLCAIRISLLPDTFHSVPRPPRRLPRIQPQNTPVCITLAEHTIVMLARCV